MTDDASDTLAAALLGRFTANSRDHAFICMDPRGTVVTWNEGAARVFGYAPQEAIGRNLAFLFTDDDLARGQHRYELLLAARDTRSEDDRWHLRKDGMRIWVTGTVEAIRDGAGGLLGFVKVARDRTDLRAQVERYEQASEHSRSFFRTLGHELGNALFPLNNVAALIRRSPAGGHLTAALALLDNQVAVLAGLADDLANVERLERGTLALKPVCADLREAVANGVRAVEETARERQVRLEAFPPEAPIEVEIDPPRFQQVMLNLLGNAVKYTPPGGTVYVKITQEGHEALVRVEDTGIGIAPDMLPRIFELFTRATAAAEMEPSGLGVGLNIVKQIVELHGGTVQARSAGSGQGAEFTVRLPALPPPAARSGTAARHGP